MGATRRLAVTLVQLVAGATAQGQWTVTSLHPPGASWSRALDVHGGQQVGYVGFDPAIHHAALWTGSPESFVNLNPPGCSWSEARGVYAGQQTGVAKALPVSQAGTWTGTAASWSFMTVPNSWSSFAEAASDEQQVGLVRFLGGQDHACVWSGTGGSVVDLHPKFGGASIAIDAHDGQQVGYVGDSLGAVFSRAALWHGSADTYVDLTPFGHYGASAQAVYAGQQAGWAGPAVSFLTHAGTWQGTASSWVDLHPDGSLMSWITSTHAGQHAGSVYSDGLGYRAWIWTGTTSWDDLSVVLPPNVVNSEALGIWRDAKLTYVVGYAYDQEAQRQEALLWTRPINCYVDCDHSGSIDLFDFLCFKRDFDLNEAYADCDNSGTLDVFDYLCFQNQFAGGCP